MKEKPFWISIRKAEDCLFSRRNGYVGKIIFGYSVCLRLFGFDIFKGKQISSSKEPVTITIDTNAGFRSGDIIRIYSGRYGYITKTIHHNGASTATITPLSKVRIIRWLQLKLIWLKKIFKKQSLL